VWWEKVCAGVWWEKAEGKKPLERPTYRRQGNNTMDHQEVGWRMIRQ
jgi:hypothetical protein